MSLDGTSVTHGVKADNGEAVSRLGDKIDVLNLHNTEDVDQTTTYAQLKLSSVMLTM